MAIVPFETARFNDYRERTRRFAAGFTTGQKAMVLIAAVAAVIGGYTFYHGQSKQSYGILFSNLSPADAGAVTSQLQSAHVPFKVTDGGTTITVPQSQVNLERISLAQKGLPSSGTVGFSTLEKSGITTSDFVQQVEYQQALEGQLSSTIQSIQGVQAAKVTLAVAQQSPFAVSNQPSPTASVLVALDPGSTLAASQVQAIVHLTASTVPGLSPSDVTVVDNHGNVLSAPGVSLDASAQQQQTQAYDTATGAAIQTMLDRVLGPGNSTVEVHATLNFDQVKTTSQQIQTGPNGQPVIAPTSQSSTQQSYTGTGTPPAGILGSGNPPQQPNGTGNYTNNQTQTTNAVGQVTQNVQQAPGSVSATTVAVLVNSSAARGISPAQVQTLVAAAAGLPANQANAVSVAMVPFSNAAASQASAAAKSAAAAQHSTALHHEIEAAALVAVLLVLMVLAWRTARRRRPAYEEIPLSELGPIAQELPIEVPAAEVTAQLPAANPMRADMDRYIDDNPDEVATLLRQWAAERRRPERSAT